MFTGEILSVYVDAHANLRLRCKHVPLLLIVQSKKFIHSQNMAMATVQNICEHIILFVNGKLKNTFPIYLRF